MAVEFYIVQDEMATVVAAVKTALNLPVLNYQFGYFDELNETLQQMEIGTAGEYANKFPMIWLAEPFEIDNDKPGVFGIADIDLFLINQTDRNWKAKERLDNNFKTVLYPIYQELLRQIVLSAAFSHTDPAAIPHKHTHRYKWGEGNKHALNDVVDCLKIPGLKLRISEKQNCSIFSTF